MLMAGCLTSRAFRRGECAAGPVQDACQCTPYQPFESRSLPKDCNAFHSPFGPPVCTWRWAEVETVDDGRATTERGNDKKDGSLTDAILALRRAAGSLDNALREAARLAGRDGRSKGIAA
jgi:hypothetical protein